MKVICVAALLLASFAPQARPQVAPLSLPLYVPIHCSKQAGCILTGVQAGRTGVIVAHAASPQESITDSLGNVWSNDQCVTFGGDCIYHAVFADNPNHYSDKITFVGANAVTDVWMLVYAGAWNFDSGSTGNYQTYNYPFSSCGNVGGNCPYDWTDPVDAYPGSMLIAVADNNTGNGSKQVPQAGFGYTIEATDGNLAIEDMICPVGGVYIGSLTWRAPDGSFSETGGSHWVMALAEYRRSN